MTPVSTTRRSRLAGATLCALAAVLAAASTGCDLQKADWGFQGIDQLPTPPDDPSLGCGVALPADTLATQRASCAFGRGALPEQTLGIAPAEAAQIPIRHVLVVMKENRSFDHLLGALHDAGQPDVEAIPADFSNPDAQGQPVHFFRQSNTCLAHDPGHQGASIAACVDGGRMDGFVKSAADTTDTDGHFVMSFYDASELPFDYFLASTFAVSDRHFAPMESGTFGNRNFLLFGSNVGVVDTGIVYPPPNTPSILQLLMNAKVTWGAYTDDAPLSGSLGWTASDPGVHPLADIYAALDAGTLPNVAFVDGTESVDDDHPDADLQKGEAWLRTLYEHAVTSPEWPRLALVWTYDEGGGFADHVPPPPACAAEPDSPFTRMGPRVPLVVISPWAKRNYASHVVHDHTAITRLIELLFHLPALTARDANSDALLDMFDFSCGRDLSVPPAPQAGTGDCTDPAPPGTD